MHRSTRLGSLAGLNIVSGEDKRHPVKHSHAAMMTQFRNGDHDASDRLAEQLLPHLDLLLIICARCHIVLGTGEGDYLAHAEGAVRMLD